MNYDPNLTSCGSKVKQTVKLTFGMWEYRAEMTVVIGGNCNGLTIIEAAVGDAFEKLCDDEDFAQIIMTMPNGDRLTCEDDEGRGEDWLGKMLIAAEILSIEPDGSFFDKATVSA